MKRISHRELLKQASSCKESMAFTVSGWRFNSQWSPDIFGALQEHLISEVRFEGTDDGPEDIGLFWFPKDASLDLLERMILTEVVKLIICSPKENLLESFDPDLLENLAIPGEFPDDAIEHARRLSGFKWMILIDGNELDDPYYWFSDVTPHSE